MATPYRLYYWAIPGRGEFIRQLLEYVGAPYEDVAQGPEGVSAVAALRSGTLAGCPHFAPPILQVSETLSLSQTPVISAYIAKMHGLMPDGEGKEYIAMQIDHTVQDVVTEVHATHHPVDVTDVYDSQKAEAKRAAAVVTKVRLPKLLGHLEECVATYGNDRAPFLFGEKICYVDLSCSFLLDGVEHAFPKTFQSIRGSIARLLAIRNAVRQTERIENYYKSSRKLPFADGIFRYCPELEE